MRLPAAVLSIVLLLPNVVAAQSVSTAAVSDDPAGREQVLEFLQVMDTKKQFDALVPLMQQQMQKSFANMRDTFPEMDDDDVAFMASEEQAMIGGLFKRINISQLEEAMIPIYQRHFTRPEMDSILIFYESPTGRKMRAEMPAMMAEVMQVSNEIMQPIITDLVREMRQRMDEHFKMKKAKREHSQQ